MPTTRNTRRRKTIAAEVSGEAQVAESVTVVASGETETKKPAAKKTTPRKKPAAKRTTSSRAKTTKTETQTATAVNNVVDTNDISVATTAIADNVVTTDNNTAMTDSVVANTEAVAESVSSSVEQMNESIVASTEVVTEVLSNNNEQTMAAVKEAIDTQAEIQEAVLESVVEQVEVITDADTAQNWFALGQELHDIGTSTASRLLQCQMNIVHLTMEQGAQQLNLLNDTQSIPAAMQAEMDLLLQTQQQLLSQAQGSMQAMVDFQHDMQVWLGKTAQLAQTDVPNPLQLLKK